MTSRRGTLIIVAIIAAVVIGIVVALNTRAAFADTTPVPEPTPVVIAVTGEEPTPEPTAVPVLAVTAEGAADEPTARLRWVFVPWVER
jgi:hypothetical protein